VRFPCSSNHGPTYIRHGTPVSRALATRKYAADILVREERSGCGKKVDPDALKELTRVQSVWVERAEERARPLHDPADE